MPKKTLADALVEMGEKEDPKKKHPAMSGSVSSTGGLVGSILAAMGGAAATGCGSRDTMTGVMLDQIPDIRHRTDIDELAEKHGPRKDMDTPETEEQENERFLRELVKEASDRGKLKNAKGKIPERLYYSDEAPDSAGGYGVSIGGGMVPKVTDFIIPGSTGRGAVFIKPGALDGLPPETRKWVISHEMGHQTFGETDRYGDEDATTRDAEDGGDQMYGTFPFKKEDEGYGYSDLRDRTNDAIKKNLSSIIDRFLARQK